ncbi:hypothetical protein RI367_000952 [Sorochytrium milnesiophthora]
MSSSQGSIVLTILLTVGVEVLLRIVTLTKARITRLSVTFYVFWASCILGYVSSSIIDFNPVVRVNLVYRVIDVIFYPLAYCCYQTILLNRLKVMDVNQRIKNWHYYALMGVSAAVALMTDMARFVGNLIIMGVMSGSLASFPALVSTSVLFFSIVNLCLYAITLRFMRSFKASSHAKKIYVVVAVIVALDLYDLIITAQGDFFSGYQESMVVYMVKMRLELEVWDDFVRLTGKKTFVDQSHQQKLNSTTVPASTTLKSSVA